MIELDESREWCGRVMRMHSASFYLATRLLAEEKRRAIESFYGFCRFADDTADEPGLTIQERRRQFKAIRGALLDITSGERRGPFPWHAALADAIHRFPVDVQDAFELIDGCEYDLDCSAIASLEDLERYASAVAGTVGRATIRILGATDADSLRRSAQLGIAMQLTNVLRDVQEDRDMGRTYVPFSAYPGHSERQVMRLIADRAHRYYGEADVLFKRVPNDGSRVAISLARNLYEGILNVIERRGFNWRDGRAVVSLPQKISITARSVLSAYAGFATIK